MNTPNTRKFLNKSSPPSMFTLICLAAIGALALNMHLPSLPAMAVTFGVSYSVTTLSISLFLGMNAVFQIFVGPLSDRYGRRPIVLGSLFIFCLCSVGCILATNFEFFLICRIFQAVVVAGLVISRAAVRDSYHQDQAASILGYVTMGMAIFPLIGPALGGVLEVKFGWIASFWVLLGVGIFIFLLTYFDMGETNRHKTASMTEQFHAYPELLKSRRFWGYSRKRGNPNPFVWVCVLLQHNVLTSCGTAGWRTFLVQFCGFVCSVYPYSQLHNLRSRRPTSGSAPFYTLLGG